MQLVMLIGAALWAAVAIEIAVPGTWTAVSRTVAYVFDFDHALYSALAEGRREKAAARQRAQWQAEYGF